MGLKDRLLKNSSIADAATLAASKLFETKDIIKFPCKMLNLATSGDALEGGMRPGIIQIAAESKHFKSKFAITMTKAFIEQYPDGVVLFYDSEWGSPESYFEEMNISNIIHCPVLNLEEFKNDLVKQLSSLTEKDKVLVLVDSLGNMPSLSELENSLDGKNTADMKRAKTMKSLFRMITPLMNKYNVYGVMINHTYKTLDLYSKEVVSGGRGSVYNSNIVWTITKAKEKETIKYTNEDGKAKTSDELAGFRFTLNAHKSRYVKEDSKFPIVVRFDNGISEWSGMFDLAVEAGYIRKVTAQTYALKTVSNEDIESGKAKAYRRKEIEDNDDYMTMLFETTDFNEYLKKEFQI